MLNIYQRTICKPLSFKGRGLHSGKESNITILPGNEDQGIIFKRTDLKSKNIILANHKNVCSAKLCTTLENEFGVKVSTVEHILAALYISEIDNATKEFLQALEKEETKILSKKRKYLKILNKIILKDGEREISIEPTRQSFEVCFRLNYENKVIGKQSNKINFQIDDLKDIYESRTFCLFEDIEEIKKSGLAKGGSLENAVVVDKDKVLNKEGLRNNKEFVNHKILDLAGDFLLSGYRVLGYVNCYQGGHALTNKFLRKLFDSKKSTSVIELKDEVISKKINHQQLIKIAVSA